MLDTTHLMADGRELAVVELGAPDGTPTVFFHGAPSSRLALTLLDDELAAVGVRVIAPDRPGFGGSTPQPGRRLEDAAADVAQVADALGLATFAVAGHSSGGPYAVAAAAQLTHRVSAALVVAGATDMSWPPAWVDYVDLEAELMRCPDVDAAVALATERLGADGGGFLEASGFAMPAPDLALLDDPVAGTAEFADIIEAFRQGVVGYAVDVFIQGRRWAFDPASITAPVRVVHGELDTLVPRAHSEHTASLIPGATLEIRPGQGHLSIIREFPTLFAPGPARP